MAYPPSIDEPDDGEARGLGPRLPLRLGRYTLCDELGSGGMATVYLARMDLAPGMEKLVALKTIHPHLAKEQSFVDMFLDEAHIASQVSHPNVCATFDFGQVGGTSYLAMEYLIGEPLVDLINRVAADPEPELLEVLPFLAARIIADAAEGVHAAHEATSPDGRPLGIVHRDISPQNLFVTYEGAVKVVDFGCAKAVERVAHTSTGMLKGKVAYAAPEQLRSGPVDGRTDVWALGVCLWEAVALTALFHRDSTVETAMTVLQEHVPLATEGRPWVPPELAAIADRAISRDPDERYPTAREMGRDLRRYITESGVTLESAEVAEWMEYLFHDRHEKLRRRADEVQHLDLSEVASVASLLSADDVELLDDEEEAAAAVVPPATSVPFELATAVPPSERETRGAAQASPTPQPARSPVPDPNAAPPAKRRGRGFALAALALLLLLGAGVGAYALGDGAGWLGGAGVLRAEDEGGAAADDRPGASGHLPEAAGVEPEAVMEGVSTAAGAADEDGPGAPPAAGTEAERDPPADEAPPRRGRATTGYGSVTTVVGSGGGSARSGGYGGGTTTVFGSSPTTVTHYGGAAPTAAPVPPPVPPPTPPEPAPPQPEEALAMSGTLQVVARGGGWARVELSGRNLGRTPVRTRVQAGRYRLRVYPHGESPPFEDTVEVTAGETATRGCEVEARD
ncbi:MAG: protein kinase [Sandaracinaceae bacterium]